jgi:dephospho-CoA kinase
MPKLIIGFVGQLASGKDASKKYLEDKYGASSHRFSTMLRDILNRIYVPIDRQNLQDLSLDLRNRFGSDTLARVIAEDVKNDSKEIVIVDGVRRMDDIINLKNVEGFFLVGIEAKPEIRYERMKTRNENVGDDKKSFADFIADGQKEAELEIPAVMNTARYTINNDGTLEELYKQIDEIIINLKK